MSNFFTKLFGIANEKSVSYNPGSLNLLRAVGPGPWERSNYLEQYTKSLYVYACVSKRAEKTATIELHLYQIMNSSGDVREVKDHPALDLIYRVNPFQTKTEFIEATVINLDLTGDAFWYKVRDDRGQVIELWNLRPDLMTVIKDPEKYILGYEFQKSSGSKEYFDKNDIVHHKYPAPLDEFMGVSPLGAAKTRIETEQYASEYQRDFFVNSARPDAVLKFAGELAPEQKKEARASFNLRHNGRGKNNKIAILEGGVDYQQISISQREMDFIESMKFTRDDILVAFKVPKPIIAVTDDVNRANAETALEIFQSETIKPLMARLVEKLNEELLAVDFSDTLFFDFTDPTPESKELKIQEWESGLTHNYLLINEVREQQGLPPISGGWTYYGPIMNSPLGGLDGKSVEKTERKQSIVAIEQDPNKLRQNKGLMRAKKIAFQGRLHVKQKLQIREKLMNELRSYHARVMKAKLSAQKRSKEEKNNHKGNPVPFIKDAEVRKAYANAVVKAIDKRAEDFEKAMNTFANQQMKRILDNLSDADIKAIEKKLNMNVIFDMDREEKLMSTLSLPYIQELLKSAGQDALKDLKPEATFDITPNIAEFLKKRAKMLADSVNSTTAKYVADTLAEGLKNGEGIADLTARVQEVYKEFPIYRAETIARTEATAANNEGFMHAYKQSGVATHKEWVATHDGRTREEHIDLDGEIVPVDKAFSNGLQYPQEINCRCVIAPAFEE